MPIYTFDDFLNCFIEMLVNFSIFLNCNFDSCHRHWVPPCPMPRPAAFIQIAGLSNGCRAVCMARHDLCCCCAVSQPSISLATPCWLSWIFFGSSSSARTVTSRLFCPVFPATVWEVATKYIIKPGGGDFKLGFFNEFLNSFQTLILVSLIKGIKPTWFLPTFQKS